MFFNARVDVGKGADSAGNGAGGDFLARGDEAFAATREFRIGFSHFQAKSHGFSVDAMRAADAGRHLEFVSAALDGGEPVSYTHLDVYKRQSGHHRRAKSAR